MTDLILAKEEAVRVSEELSELYLAAKEAFEMKYPELEINISVYPSMSSKATGFSSWVTIKQ